MTRFEKFKLDRIEELIDRVFEAKNLTVEELAQEVLYSRLHGLEEDKFLTDTDFVETLASTIKWLNGNFNEG